MDKTNVYFDMDGTMAEWLSDSSFEEVASKGYFLKLPVVANVCKAFELLSQEPNINTFVLSAVFSDNHSIQEKKIWLKEKAIPQIKEKQMIFCPYEVKKSDVLKEKRKTDILIDDFTKNLKEWHGIGIKMYNGINGTNGTWDGYSVFNRMSAIHIKNQILAICNLEKRNVNE